MQEKISVKWNIIKYKDDSLNKDIFDVLEDRFEWMNYWGETMKDLEDPFLLKDMDKAVKRILEAQKNNEKVMIFWDYDVDGVTSTSILMHFFKKIWILASYRLPHRVHDWYWLKKYFIDDIEKAWATLVVTVDCWTRDIEVIKYAKSKWIDVIVTDHHAVPEIIPVEAVAIINPKRTDCNYPFKFLAWAGVAFKVMSAVASKIFSKKEYDEYLQDTIDIAAIWTVADCMPIIWENRVIVIEWLKQLKNSRSNGIRKLIEDKIHEDLDSDVFGFLIGPRLNAAGRMDTPYKAVNLILNNWETLGKTLRDIEALNEQRKFLTKDFTQDALDKINPKNNLLFYESKDIWHWIIWIVAGRLTEQFYKPSIVLKDEWDKLVASCRSPEYFSIIDILEKYKEYFIGFGWHKQAAGFSIKKDKYMDFKIAILKDMNSMDLSKHKKEIKVDKLVSLNELWFWFLEKVNKFKPYWIWNIKPVFMVENLEYEKFEFLWKGREHVRFNCKSWFKIFWFFMWEFYDKIKKAEKVDLIFDISEDNWMGKRNLMLKIVDVVV